jgi:DNA helicase-2/ATP-dependent DNA helicase PcrA
VYLEQNYRSTKTILEAAQSVISANSMRKEKHLFTERPQGRPITLHEAYDEQEEAAYVVSQIERLVASGEFRLRDFAVMYRVNAQSRAMEDAFRRRGIPYKLVGTKFYDRKEIKDVIAFLRFIYNPYDTVSLLRIINLPPRGLGSKTIAELQRWAQGLGLTVYDGLRCLKYGPDDNNDGQSDSSILKLPVNVVSPFNPRAEQSLIDVLNMFEDLMLAANERDLVELIEAVLKRTGYGDYVKDGSEEGEDRWQNIKELQVVASDYVNLQPMVGLATFLEEIALVADSDEYEPDAEAVTLITLHAAKGLEFPVVFIAGVEDGICPHMRSFDDTERMEEERRLFYVGMTRAEERLFLLYTFRRRMAGGSTMNAPSRYLADIPERLLWTTGTPTQAASTPVKRAPVQPAGPPTIMSRPASRPEPRYQPRYEPQGQAHFESHGEPVIAENLPSRSSFKSGDRVRHAKFGEGIVLETRLDGRDEEITVLFAGAHGRKTLLLSLAKLEYLG